MVALVSRDCVNRKSRSGNNAHCTDCLVPLQILYSLGQHHKVKSERESEDFGCGASSPMPKVRVSSIVRYYCSESRTQQTLGLITSKKLHRRLGRDYRSPPDFVLRTEIDEIMWASPTTINCSFQVDSVLSPDSQHKVLLGVGVSWQQDIITASAQQHSNLEIILYLYDDWT